MRLAPPLAALALAAAGVGATDLNFVPAGVEIVPASYRAAGCLDRPACQIGAAILSAEQAGEARFVEQDFAGVYGLGIAATNTNADRDEEIQGPIADLGVPGERLTVTFAVPHVIDRIVIGHLYNPNMPGDPMETAIIEGFSGEESLGILRLQSVDDTAGAFTLEGNASVGAVRRLDVTAGQYVLFSPFGAAVDRVVLTGAEVVSGDTADFSLVALGARPAR